MTKEEKLQTLDNVISALQNARLPIGGTIAEFHGYTQMVVNICSALSKLHESLEKGDVPHSKDVTAKPSLATLAMVPKEGDGR